MANRTAVVSPDGVVQESGCAGVPGDATGMRSGHRQPSIGRPFQIGPGPAGSDKGGGGDVAHEDDGLGQQAKEPLHALRRRHHIGFPARPVLKSLI